MFWNVLYSQACFTPSHRLTLHFYHTVYVLNLFTWEVIFIQLTTSQLVNMHSMHITQTPALRCDFGSLGKGFPLTAKVPCPRSKKLVLWGLFLNYFLYYTVIDPQLSRLLENMAISGRPSVKLVGCNFLVSSHFMDVHARVMRSNNELFIIWDLWVCSFNEGLGSE